MSYFVPRKCTSMEIKSFTSYLRHVLTNNSLCNETFNSLGEEINLLNWIVCDTPAMRMVRERGETNNPVQLIDPSGYIYGVLHKSVVRSARLIGNSHQASTLWTAPDAARVTVVNLQLFLWSVWGRRESKCDNRKWTAITRGMSRINFRHLRSAVDVCENTPTQSGLHIDVFGVGRKRCERYPMLETVLRQQALATHCPTQALVFYFQLPFFPRTNRFESFLRIFQRWKCHRV